MTARTEAARLTLHHSQIRGFTFKKSRLGLFCLDISGEKLSSKAALLFLKEKYCFGHVRWQIEIFQLAPVLLGREI